MEKVSVLVCENYNENILDNKIRSLFEYHGGINSIVKPGQNVLLKVNLLMDTPPETLVTTNPILVKSVAKIVKEAGANPVIGDSPGGPFNKKALEKAYQKAGFIQIAEEIDVDLNYNTDQISVSFDGMLNKSFVLGKFITEADVIINLAKMKTHGLTMITAAVKNLFGTIPGLLKAEYHLKMPVLSDFSNMLIDLALCVKPDFNIIDGIWGMEGDGPSSGDPRNFGYILGGVSPFAVDVAVAHVMGLKPVSKAPMIKAALERNLPASLEKIELVGDELIPADNVRIPQSIENSNLLDRILPEPIANFLAKVLRPKPVFIHEKCVGCRDCFNTCPPHVIEMKENKPYVNLEGCIRCFCCQELCQYQAVEINRPLLARLLNKL
ncbi:MAG: DUF362 domain-containing protein [Halanaerobiaceae bacterium]